MEKHLAIAQRTVTLLRLEKRLVNLDLVTNSVTFQKRLIVQTARNLVHLVSCRSL
jgi:hypothetical protein